MTTRFLLAIAWSAPNTLLGLGLGVFGICLGGSVQKKHGCIEFFGGPITSFLPRFHVSAMTLGHVILGLDPSVLDHVRRHEHVHVRQYERWGPAFLPAYFGCSIWLWLIRRDPYRDNPFEMQAYAIDDLSGSPTSLPSNRTGKSPIHKH